jgi:hypothetical protein
MRNILSRSVRLSLFYHNNKTKKRSKRFFDYFQDGFKQLSVGGSAGPFEQKATLSETCNTKIGVSKKGFKLWLSGGHVILASWIFNSRYQKTTVF